MTCQRLNGSGCKNKMLELFLEIKSYKRILDSICSELIKKKYDWESIPIDNTDDKDDDDKNDDNNESDNNRLRYNVQ